MHVWIKIVRCQNSVLKQCGSRAFDGKAGALTYHTHSYVTSIRWQFVADEAILPLIDAIPNRSACSLAIRNCISFDGMFLICWDNFTCWSSDFGFVCSFLTHTCFLGSLSQLLSILITSFVVVTLSFFCHLYTVGWFIFVRLFGGSWLLGSFSPCFWPILAVHNLCLGIQIEVCPW